MALEKMCISCGFKYSEEEMEEHKEENNCASIGFIEVKG